MSWQEKTTNLTNSQKITEPSQMSELMICWVLVLAQCRDLSVLCHQKPAVAAVTMRSTHCLLVLDVLVSQLITYSVKVSIAPCSFLCYFLIGIMLYGDVNEVHRILYIKGDVRPCKYIE